MNLGGLYWTPEQLAVLFMICLICICLLVTAVCEIRRQPRANKRREWKPRKRDLITRARPVADDRSSIAQLQQHLKH